MFIKFNIVKMCPIFVSSQLSCLAQYQKILWECSFGCKHHSISTATLWNYITFITLIKGLLSMDIRSCQHLPTVSCRRTERTTINPTRNLCLQPSFRTACQLTLPSEDHTGTTGNREIFVYPSGNFNLAMLLFRWILVIKCTTSHKNSPTLLTSILKIKSQVSGRLLT